MRNLEISKDLHSVLKEIHRWSSLKWNRTLTGVVSDILRGLDINLPVQAAVPDLPPWHVPLPAVTYTPTSKDVYPPLQRQLALETIADVSMSVPVDGSVQADGRAACAVFSPTMESPVPADSWIGRRLPTSSSSTYCELNAILDAVTLLVLRRVNGVIICDSQSALQALSSPRPICGRAVGDILCRLAAAQDASLVVSFGLTGNDTADRLAKAACMLDGHAVDAEPSLRCLRNIIYSAGFAMTVQRRDTERANSVSIQHHDHFLHSRYKYRRRGLMVRKNNVVSARLRMGYRPLWQVSQTLDMPQYTSCKLCDRPNANTLDHYCLQCPTVRDVLPRGQNLIQICSFLLNDDNLDVILARYPHFGGH
ncbi:hypothetical protein SK128_002699 [Halocaridina rubra]|uniref:RNase H type-1 domain-containing protein n=1 Tax=Halocaridina rubra TaxID=373956 RepID=A0AAN9FWW6_HALRR